jgi:hypothetical protein
MTGERRDRRRAGENDASRDRRTAWSERSTLLARQQSVDGSGAHESDRRPHHGRLQRDTNRGTARERHGHRREGEQDSDERLSEQGLLPPGERESDSQSDGGQQRGRRPADR